MDVTIAKEDILIFVLVSFPRREQWFLHRTVESDKRFSEITKAYIFYSLTPALASTDSESIDSDSDH